jgi:hypothetical protein
MNEIEIERLTRKLAEENQGRNLEMGKSNAIYRRQVADITTRNTSDRDDITRQIQSSSIHTTIIKYSVVCENKGRDDNYS